jgi:hypothetical protein
VEKEGEGVLASPNTHQLTLPIYNTRRSRKMAPFIRKKLIRVCEAQDKDKNPLSEEEVYFIQTCCQIMKSNDSDKMKFLANTVVMEWDRNPALR